MRESHVQKIEVHVAGICMKDDKILVARRTMGRSLYPGLWECGGGQVYEGENFEEAIKRQFSEEFGVIAEPQKVLDTYEIDSDTKILGVRFLMEFKGYSGDSLQKSEEHVEVRWQPIDTIDNQEFIPGLKDVIRNSRNL